VTTKHINVLTTNTQLSRLIADIEEHREDELIIARNAHPVARSHAISQVDDEAVNRRIGAARIDHRDPGFRGVGTLCYDR